MSHTNIIQLPQPFIPPLPPTASIRVAIRVLKSLIAKWKILLSWEYPETMPRVVSHYWSVAFTILAALGQLPPVIDTVADLRKQFDQSPSRRRQRVGLVEFKDTVGQAQLAA